MAKNTEDIVKALKLKAQPKANGLTLRMGLKKHALPFEVRTLASEKYVFVHVPPAAAVMKVTDNGLELVEDAAEAAIAQASFRQSRKKSSGGRVNAPAQLPADLQAALSKIPTGHKLVFDASGAPRLVKTRKRRK